MSNLNGRIDTLDYKTICVGEGFYHSYAFLLGNYENMIRSLLRGDEIL